MLFASNGLMAQCAPASFGANGPYNFNSPAVTLTTNPATPLPALYENVVFGGPGITNTATGVFDPSSVGGGIYNVNVNWTCGMLDIPGSANTSITVCNLMAACQNVTVTLDQMGNYTLDPALVNNGSSDNVCGGLMFSVSPNTFDCGDLGDNMVTLTVENAQGMMETCNAIVTVNAFCPSTIEIMSSDADNSICENAADVDLSIVARDGNGVVITCLNDSGTYTGIGAAAGSVTNGAMGSNEATFDPSGLEEGNYMIRYDYECASGAMRSDIINLFVAEVPNASLKMDSLRNCTNVPGTFYLNSMLAMEATNPGNWDLVDHPGSADNEVDNVTDILNYFEAGCYEVEYTPDNPYGCTYSPMSESAFIYITENPKPNFDFDGDVGGCAFETITINVTNTSPTIDFGTTTRNWTTNEGSVSSSTALEPTFTITPPGDGESKNITICLEETVSFTDACGTIAAPADCVEMRCRTVVYFNDGLECNSANCESLSPGDVCEIETTPKLTLECSTIGLEVEIPYDIATADMCLVGGNAPISCVEPSIDVEYRADFLNASLLDNVTGGQGFGDLPVAGEICDIILFEFCLDLGLVDFCVAPLKAILPDFIIDACTLSFAQFIVTSLGKIAGGDGGGYVVVADTDGDGAFDFAVDDGSLPSLSTTDNPDCLEPAEILGVPVNFDAAREATIPNNVRGTGPLTVRIVSAWPDSPAGVCGDNITEGPDLLDLIPIGAIPVVGPPIKNALEAAQCGIDLAFSDEETLELMVINDLPPGWANCPPVNPTDGVAHYIFSVSSDCATRPNWSIPLAYDGCDQSALPFLDGAGNSPGVRKVEDVDDDGIVDPNPGDLLAPGLYEVGYEATSCNGLKDTCMITIRVTEGNVPLICPQDLTVSTDIDVCDAVVTGISPVSGATCYSELSYTLTGETAGGGMEDASGETFELGTTTVTYTMLLDINGDGDTDDQDLNGDGDVTTWDNEMQTCMFDVTVEDRQKPVAECQSFDFTLDENGMAILDAQLFDAGSNDNCPGAVTLMVARPGDMPSTSVSFNCGDLGNNYVNLYVTDVAGNLSTCIANVNIISFLDDFQLTMDLPEICMEAPNPAQLDFTNYLTITRPDGTLVSHDNLSTVGPQIMGAFGISAFLPGPGSPTPDPNDQASIDEVVGTLTQDGMYTIGTGYGYITVSYLLFIANDEFMADDEGRLSGCYKIVHEIFEVRQPLELEDPMCLCVDLEDRQVELGVISGGLEPYTLQYTGATLDIDKDGTADDFDGSHTFNMPGDNIDDFMQDLGILRVNYTEPVWAVTIVDARGCELFASGSCDNADLEEGPEIDCMGANDFDSEVYLCERQYEWFHALPTDNCAVTFYSYQILNPDGTISGPYVLNALIDEADDGVPLAELFEAEYEFELGTSVVSYYAEDAVGNVATCEFIVIVEDNDPPYFINCPRPDVIVSTEFGHCDAYVNFSPPLAEDNCDFPTVTQIDDTGLSIGDRFPIGTTILIYQATDAVGNKAICKVKVTVNNYWNTPEIVCPENMEVTNDDWLCAASVNNIAPEATELCQDDLIVSYQVETDGEVTHTGLTDASTVVSGHLFPVGVSTVTYRTQNQPLLLISEISQDADALIGGMNPPPIINEFQCFADTLFPLTNGGTGEGLVFYPSDDVDSPDDDKIYHYSGDTDGDEYFEEIYFPGMCPQPNHVSGDTYGPDAAGRVFGMVWVPDSTKFIAMDENLNMYKVSTTGDFVLLDNMFAGPNPLAGFIYVNDTYYGIDGSNTNLVEFDPSTGMVVSSVAMVSDGDAIINGIDIALDPVSGDAYVLYNAGASAYLGTLDLATGAITELGATGVDFDAITVDGTGQVYAMSSDDAGETLYTIKCDVPGDDYIEITNFGPGDYDISCLVITRECPDGSSESFTVPEETILIPGSVLTLHYGPGVDNTFGPNYFYNHCEGSDQDANSACSYTLSYGNNTNIDAMTMFADATAGIIREDLFDTDTPADFVLAEDCLAITLDEYNPIYPDPFDNGSETALQSEPMATAECAFDITVLDAEAPMCMEIDDVTVYTSTDPIVAVEGECNQSIITVPEADDCILTEINVFVEGSITGAESITLNIISPAGDTLALYDQSCNGDAVVDITFDDEADDDASAICNDWTGTYMPEGGMLMTFYTQKLAGDWTLFIEVETGSGAVFNLDSWSIEATCMMAWEMDDVTINNMPTLCGSEYTWIHPYFVDNCTIGTIEVSYSSMDDIEVPEGGLLLDNFGKGGYEVTEFFEVGTTEVLYTLTDGAGIQSTCSFNVTVLDVEDPVITFCPDDIIIQLDGGECRKVVFYEVLAEDNCEVVSIVGVPPSGIFYEIGVTPVTVTVTDASGNTSICTFNVIVLEHVPTSDALSCNNNITLTLDQNCEAEMHADYVLEGDDYYCYENYCIEVHTLGGILHPTTFDLSDVGQTFQVTITDCVNSFNSCWGYVTIEEKLIPEILCPPDTVLYCTIDPLAVDEDGNLRTGEMELISCEESYTTLFEDEVIDNGECENPVETILRTFYLTDNDGHTVSCTQTITIEQFDFSQIEWPADVVLDCEEAYLNPALTHPDSTGYPEIEGVIVDLADEVCNLSHGYSDQELWICGSSYEILRTWIVRNRCFGVGPDNPIQYTQLIEVLDRVPPKLQGCPEDMTISTNPWSCSASTDLPVPALLYDGCAASTFSARIFGGGYIDVTGNIDDGTLSIYASNINNGAVSTVVYYVEDECGNKSSCSFTITVKDLTPPTIVAAENIILSLTSANGDDAVGKLFSEDIDKGSFDNCTGIEIEIRREDDPCGFEGNTTYSDKIPEQCDPWYDNDDHDYGKSVKFCCADLTEIDENGTPYGLVKVWIRAWDDANGDGIYGSYNFEDNPGNDHDHCDILDNYNESWILVRVEDKAPVTILCPPDITIPCDWDFTDLSITGEAQAIGTCEIAEVNYIDWVDVHCGEGTVLREWKVADSDYLCVQTITIEAVDYETEVVCPTVDEFESISGNPEVISFNPFEPNKIVVDCQQFEFPEPWTSSGACSLLGISSTIDTFWFEEGACFKAIKQWTMVDWCNMEEYECEFVVSVVDTDGPEVMCQDTCVAVNDYWDDDNDGNACELEDDVELSATAFDDGDCGSIWIKWVIVIDYWNDGTTDEEYSSFLAHSDPYYIEPSMSGSEQFVELDKDDASAEWAIHKVEWKAFDGCGNVSQCVQLVEVGDKKAPTPYCIDISTALMDEDAGNLVEIWASDFDLGAFDNCASPDQLKFTFSGVAPIEDLIDEEHCFEPVWEDRDNCIPLVDTLTGLIVSEETNCNNYEDGATRPDCPVDGVQKWNPLINSSAMKFIGQDWCGEQVVSVSVWDNKFNMDFCLVDLIIHGNACDGVVIPKAMIVGSILTEDGLAVEEVMMFNYSDQVNYPLSLETDGTGVFAFEDQVMNFDYYIEGYHDKEHLNGVSTLDLLLMQKHVLGQQPLNSAYKVIAADVNHDENVTAIDLIELRKLILGIYNDFPTNDSWRFISTQTVPTYDQPFDFEESRTVDGLSTDMMEENFIGVKIGDVNGSVVPNLHTPSVESRSEGHMELIADLSDNGSIVIKAGDRFEDIYGFQMTLKVKGDFEAVLAKSLDVNELNFGKLDNKTVTVSYHSVDPLTFEEGEALFEMVGLNSLAIDYDGYTKVEAYRAGGDEIISVALRGQDNSVAYQLYQNKPNPFTSSTVISFLIPTDAEATIKVFDATGRKVFEQVDNYTSGVNTLEINNEVLDHSAGVFYYQLECNTFTATKKMILLD